MAEITLFEFQNYKFSARPEDKLRVIWYEDPSDQPDKLLVRRLGYRTRLATASEQAPYDPYDQSPHVGQIAIHKFCRGADLVEFRGIATFPYAEEVVTTGGCPTGGGGCDLVVAKVDVTHESEQGKNDGVAIVTATSTFSGFTFSLDNVTFQASNKFENLVPGGYTVYVRDAQECAASLAFTVNTGNPIAYGLRFYLDYSDYTGKKMSLRIFKKFFDGVPETVCASEAPTIINYEFESGNRFKVLIGSRLDFTLLATVEEQFTEFFTYDEREFRVEYWYTQPDHLIWMGYVLPDMYGEPWTHTPKFISLTATDGVGTLKDRPFVDPLGKPYFGPKTPFEVIRLCLKPLGIPLGYLESISWYPKEANQSGDVSPLLQLEEDVAQYYDKEGKADSCDDVITKILGPLGAQLKQSRGYWVIDQPNWISYKENPDDPPPPPDWPPVSFDLYNPRLIVNGFNFSGHVNLVNIAGGSPGDGVYEYSLDEITWAPITTLEFTLAGYVLTGLPMGSTRTVSLRRPLKPQEIASRVVTIPSILSDSLTVKATFNVSTGNAQAIFTRLVNDYDVEVKYETYKLGVNVGDPSEKVAEGTLVLSAGALISFKNLEGKYLFINRYDFQIIQTTPATSYEATTRLAPVGSLDLFGK